MAPSQVHVHLDGIMAYKSTAVSKTRFALIILLYSFVSQLYSQTKITGLADEQYNYFILKDSYGFTWISSSHKLNRYDGSKVKQYSQNIKGNWIQGNLIEDSGSNIWTSTYEYIVKYDRTNDSITSFQLTLHNKIINQYYHIIEYDRYSEKLLLRAGQYLILYDTQKNSVFQVIDNNCIGRRFSVYKNEQGVITKIVALPTSEKVGFSHYERKINKEWAKSHSSFINTSSNVHFYDAISQGDHFLSATSDGIFKIRNSVCEKIHKPKGSKKLLAIERLDYKFLIILDSDGTLFKFDVQTGMSKEIQNPLPQGESPKGLYRKGNLTFMQSSEGGVWFFSDFELTREEVKLKRSTGEVYGISEYQNYLITIAQNGIFLLKTDSQPLWIIDNEQRIKHVIRDNKNQGYWGANISNLYWASDRELKWKRCNDIDLGRINSLRSLENEAISASTSKGTYLIDIQDNNCITADILSDLNIHEYFMFEDTSSIFITNDNIVKYCTGNKCQNLLTDTYVFSISEAQTNDGIFLNTRKGLFYCSRSGKLKEIIDFETIGFTLEIISSLDIGDALILVTPKGLYKYQTNESQELIRYENAGLNSISLPSRSSIGLINGNDLYLGSKAGLLLSDLKNLTIAKDRPFIDNISNNNKSLLIDRLEDQVEMREFDANENNISITSSIPEYSKMGCARIVYSIGGVDFTQMSGETAYFNNLLPGNHTIKVVGINSSNLVADSFSFSFKISPPYHQTWWFRSGLALGFIGLGFAVNFLNTRRKLTIAERKLEKQKALSAQREKIADDLHDELGTDLSKILYLSDEASELKDDQKKDEIIDDITSLAASSIRNMRDMLWVLEDKHNSLESLMTKLRTSIRATLKEYPIDLDFIMKSNDDDELSSVIMSGEQRQHILLILKEAVHNVIKHAEASDVSVTISFDDPQLNISVRDNGKGISNTNEYMQPGRGLSSMKRRAEKIGAEMSIENIGDGTEVRLSVVLPRV